MDKHFFLLQWVNCKIFPVAFHRDSIGEKFDKTNKNSWMNNTQNCAKMPHKVWGSLIPKRKALGRVCDSCAQRLFSEEASQLSLSSAPRREERVSTDATGERLLPFPFIIILPVPRSLPQISLSLGILGSWHQLVTLSPSSYRICLLRASCKYFIT